ncbi:bifunctional demethylmenaquinone methyltransferase/2-methoxy-6-polyprenyl-1,4-benzoquinol methylase UbiE [Hydrogenophaga sp. 5NK40-0174]
MDHRDARLATYFDDEEQRLAVTAKMFNEGAVGYDTAERLTALGSGSWYRREVLQRCGLKPGMRTLDVAAGTGLVTQEAVKIVGEDGQVIALDPSPGMLTELRKKVKVETIEAFAESIPLDDNNVDFLSMGYALRHVSDLDKVFSEYLRVLKPGGSVCVMEISRPTSLVGRWLLKAHIGLVVPALAFLTGKRSQVAKLWAYYSDTIEAAVDPAEVQDALRRAGFEEVGCHVTMGIFREYVGIKPQA